MEAAQHGLMKEMVELIDEGACIDARDEVCDHEAFTVGSILISAFDPFCAGPFRWSK